VNETDINVVALGFAIETAKSSGVLSAAQILSDAREYAAFLEPAGGAPSPEVDRG
jgi:hypothetical protein